MEKTFCPKNRDEWRRWLEKNSATEKEIWLIYYKKHTKKPTVAYADAVEEALCFGWIDSTVKRIDEERYMQWFLPRKTTSIWSLLNKQRAQKMIATGKMTEQGMQLINVAKKNGNWQKAYTTKGVQEQPADLVMALSKNTIALRNFKNFSQGMQNRYILYINEAKKPETRKRRIKRVVENAFNNIKPGMV